MFPQALFGMAILAIVTVAARRVWRNRRHRRADARPTAPKAPDAGNGQLPAASPGIAQILDSIPQSVFWTDRESRFIGGNPSFFRSLGCDHPQDVLGKTVRDFPRLMADAEAYLADNRYVMTSREAKRDFLEPLQMADGSRRWVQTTKVALENPAGDVTGVLGIYDDVTERVRAERAYTHLASIVNSSEDAVIGKSPEGLIVSWNFGAQKLYGYTAEEAVGKPILMIVPPERHGEVADILREVLAGTLIGQYETVRVRKDGLRINVSVTVFPIREHGEIAGVAAIARDITRRKLMERSLQRAVAYNRSLIEASLDPLVTVDSSGRIMDVNRATEAVTGVSRERLIGGEFCDFFADPKQAHTAYRKVFDEGSVKDYPLAIRHTSGRTTEVTYNATVFRNEEGEIAGIFAAARDVSRLRAAEREVRQLNEELEQRVRQRTVELEAVNRELEAFSYSVSHDLRAPLRHITGFSRILTEDFAETLPAPVQDYLAKIELGAAKMGRLIEDVLALARVGRQTLTSHRVDLRSTAEQAIKDLRPDWEDRPVEWTVGDLPAAECDGALMRLVFQNLLSNALKFTRTRTPARIEIGWDQQAVFVRDNGVGFDMKYADRLFGVFQRLHRPEEFEGTGVGLASVQRIIHRHGGRVWAQSEPGRGATFYFTVPLAAAPSNVTTEETAV